MAVGRPRAFDVEEVLDSAMLVFWRHGYDGASLADLTKAMGINPPSLYSAFGSKEGLFRAVIDRYAKRSTGFLEYVLAAPTAREVAERYLFGAAGLPAKPGDPAGCLLLQGGVSCGDNETVPQELARRRAETEAVLRERLERAQAEGDLPEGADPTALARYLSTVKQGMSVQAAAGTTPEALRQIAEVAVQAWPR